MLKPEDFFDLEGFESRDVFDDCEFVWEALSKVGRYALNYITGIDGNTISGRVMSGRSSRTVTPS